jgi:hypothetical protein
MKNIQNKNNAISAVVEEIPPKPKNPATIEMMKNTIASLSILYLPFDLHLNDYSINHSSTNHFTASILNLSDFV